MGIIYIIQNKHIHTYQIFRWMVWLPATRNLLTSLLLLEANTKPNQHHQGFAHLERILHSRVVQRLHSSWQLCIVFSKVHRKITVLTFCLRASFPALKVLLRWRSTLFTHFPKWPSLGILREALLLDWASLFTTIVLPYFVIAAWIDQDILHFRRREYIHKKHSQTIIIPVLDK